MKYLYALLFTVSLIFSCVKEPEPRPKPLIDYNTAMLHPIVIPYKDIILIDAHNHDAAKVQTAGSGDIWKKFNVSRIILFGNISESSAMYTDKLSINAYKQAPHKYIPFMAGVNIRDSSCLEYLETKFKEGAFGVGELVAASTYSPINSALEWKGNHPLDGYFPEIYQLCAEYNKPILLHIDPPSGSVVSKLREASRLYPNTNFIFAHANAYNTPSAIRDLIKDCPNIYIDFFAGFTAYNENSSFELKDYVSVINDYPTRFLVSTDSGIEVGYENAYIAIYELFNLLDMEVVKQIASKNVLRLIGEED